MFPMTVTLHSSRELQVVQSALADINAYAKARAIHAEPATPSPTMHEGNMTFTRTEAKKPAVVAPAAPAPSVAEQPATDAEKIPTYEEVTSALRRLASARGVPAAVKVLAQFDVTKAPELKPSQYAAARAAIEEARSAQKEAA